MGNGVPNFPTPPRATPAPLSMPGDLKATKRNFYTEINFVDYRSAAYGSGFGGTGLTVGGGIAGGILGGLAGARGGPIGAIIGAVTGAGLGAAVSSFNLTSTATMRLPIPRAVNDITTLSWQPISITGEVLKAAGAAGNMLAPGLSQALGAAGGLGRTGLALVGKTLNPLLFLAFNNQGFREFTFEWSLVPKNEKESETIREIIEMFKGASLPTFGIPFQEYPLIAMVKMFPNNLNGHAVFKPMAIMAVGANYTPNANPSFYQDINGNSKGAPTTVTLTVRMQEIQLWFRNTTTNKPY